MISFFIALVGLIVGFFIYGTFVDKVFKPDDRKTPCVEHPDGVDYVPMKPWRAYLIQLLNIAGLGPIFGALSGAIWGPSVYLWIVLGTIFAGGVHDYLTGMLSMRNDGASVSELTGKYLGPVMKNVMRVFSVVLLVMVGVVFMVGPAGLLSTMITGGKGGSQAKTLTAVFTIIILAYYLLATLMPIDKVIGKVYPIFGICLIVMALGIGGATIIRHINGTHPMIELWDGFKNMHPKGAAQPIWPLMFITVACGAISGFHATQSPMMARCLTSEKQGRHVFYGAMVSEGIIALIWASAGIAFYNVAGKPFSTAGLFAAGGGNSTTVYKMSVELLGPVGSILAIPLLAVGYLISFLDYNIVWRYFSWSNQTLAMIALWTGATYLTKKVSPSKGWIATIPATFMSAVSIPYFCFAPECLSFGTKLSNGTAVSYAIGIIGALLFFGIFMFRVFIPTVSKKHTSHTHHVAPQH